MDQGTLVSFNLVLFTVAVVYIQLHIVGKLRNLFLDRWNAVQTSAVSCFMVMPMQYTGFFFLISSMPKN